MAELPRYQQTGLLPSDSSKLDFADIKETIGMAKGVSASLDRLSAFAFKESYEQAQREGMQYGAENQPGVEQVMLAIEEGRSPSDLFVKPGTYFGDAARKVQATQLRTELEVRGRQDLAKLSAAIDAGPVDMKEITTRIKGLTDGFSKALAGVDAEESLKFRASMATAGNAVYTKATEKAVKMYIEGVKVLAKDALNATTQILTDTIAAEQDPTMLLTRVRSERKRVIDIANQVNDPLFMRDAMKDFDTKLVNSMVEYLNSESKSPADVFSKLQSGKVGKLSEVYKSLDKNDVIAGYMKKVTENKQILEANRAVQKLENEGAVNGLLIEYYNPTTTSVRKRDIGLQIAKMNVLSIDQMERFLNPDVKDGDPYVFADFKYKVATGVITDLDDLRNQTTASGLSGKQYAPLAEALIGRTKSDEAKGYKIIAQASGFGDIRQGKTKSNEHQYKKEEKILGYYEEAKQASILDRGSFNPEETARIAVERYNNNDKKDVQKADARKKLDKLSEDIKKRKKIKTEFYINEETNAEDLLKQKLINNDEFTFINNQQQILRREAQ